MERPVVVCLCGSTRFEKEFQIANQKETLAGRIVLSVGMFMHAQKTPITNDQKKALDELHLRKIDMADEVLCINQDDYIGASTKRELWYAQMKDKRIRMWDLPSKIDDQTIRRWFTDWSDWEMAGRIAATTVPTDAQGTSQR